MTEPSSADPSAEDEQPTHIAHRTNGQAVYVGPDIYRRVAVKGMEGVSATIVVTVRRGKVWVSIQPPFTSETILDPEKVDAVIRTLTQARDDARRTSSIRSRSRGRQAP